MIEKILWSAPLYVTSLTSFWLAYTFMRTVDGRLRKLLILLFLSSGWTSLMSAVFHPIQSALMIFITVIPLILSMLALGFYIHDGIRDRKFKKRK